jgi:hypothetical protein
LNMLGGYAADDHRAIGIRPKKVLTGILRCCQVICSKQFDDTRLSSSRMSAIAEGVSVPSFLF